jgi:hypothetical protein
MQGAADFFASHWRVCLAAFVVVSRLTDIGSTWLATPKLKLEGNPLVRKLGWPFAWSSLLLAGLPWLNDWAWAFALPVIVVSLEVSASNFSRVLFPRVLGEDEYDALVERVFRQANRGLVYGLIAAQSLLHAAVGGLLLLFYPSPDSPAYFFGLGFVTFGAAVAIHTTASARRRFRAGEAANALRPAA